HRDRRNRRTQAGTCCRRSRAILPAVAGANADRHGVDRQLPMADRSADGVRSRSVDRRGSADSSHDGAAAEDGPARCIPLAGAVGGRTLSAHLGAVEWRARSATVADYSLQAGDAASASEERAAAPGTEPGRTEEAQAVERG